RPTFLHPSSFPPSSFSQGATSHALGKQTSTEQLQKPSMKSKLLGTPPPTQASQHMPQQGIPKQDSSMHHPLTDISTPPFFHPLPPFRFPPFSQGATSHALGKQTSTEQLQKPSMKSKLFGTPPPTQAPQHMPQQGIPKQDSNMHHTLTDISTHLLASSTLPASNAPLSKGSTFLNPWQTDTNTAISKTFRIEQVPRKKGPYSIRPFTM
uniref:hypothetical protein n=1 Tax=Bartonella sp. AP57NXGY TaxID=3243497 RepID=UPI0035CFB23C